MPKKPRSKPIIAPMHIIVSILAENILLAFDVLPLPSSIDIYTDEPAPTISLIAKTMSITGIIMLTAAIASAPINFPINIPSATVLIDVKNIAKALGIAHFINNLLVDIVPNAVSFIKSRTSLALDYNIVMWYNISINYDMVLESRILEEKLKKYLSIGKFSKLSGISVRSLRYYEELGIFKPMYVDAETGYRYYQIEQMDVLYVIMVCLETGIPLKEIKGMQIGKNSDASKIFLEKGRELTRLKIEKCKSIIRRLDSIIGRLDTDMAYVNQQGKYDQYFGEIEVVAVSCSNVIDVEDEEQYKKVSELFINASASGAEPSYCTGGYGVCGEDGIDWYVFVETLGEEKSEMSMVIPSGMYECINLSEDDVREHIRKRSERGEFGLGTIIVLYGMLDEFANDSIVRVQVLRK